MESSRKEIAARHADEWRGYRENILNPAKESQDEKQAKTAKCIADAIRLAQDGERRAQDFGEKEAADAQGYELGWIEDKE